MLARSRSFLLSGAVGRPVQKCAFRTSLKSLREREAETARSTDYEAKYSEKLQKRAQEYGKSVAELRIEIKEREKERRRQQLILESQKNQGSDATEPMGGDAPSLSRTSSNTPGLTARKDSSPVKPLNSILNLDRLLKSPHTPEQLSVLWRVYHSSRSGGTGRGFLSASVPLDKYRKMIDVAMRYPSFVVPVPKPNAQTDNAGDKPAYEFYFMEWGFHGSPPESSTGTDIFSTNKPSSNPQTSTILFTPLQEYKLRNSFATPYLVLTHYTDLSQSHGVVLLRGEITPSATNTAAGSDGGGDHFLLSQQDAQLLAITVQRFYLWSEGENERTALLQAFHDNPEDFKWEDLLKHAEYSL
ncbi:hypothetical protein AcW1_000255 [Taiwanofungus camphoratus]|nr:hypothetical protein AcW2_001249 [Antrodia cinnamomea]KAI0961080.1 hypothetical protein AcV7_000276 [Antrodia cinnamomea]KAI0963070.1 hypothetical protein AcW1_000255 [Antrodia cinnamomea]